MQLIRQVYRDKHGNDWIIEKQSLPKKRGEYTFWTAECRDRSLRDEQKRLLIKQIENATDKSKSQE